MKIMSSFTQPHVVSSSWGTKNIYIWKNAFTHAIKKSLGFKITFHLHRQRYIKNLILSKSCHFGTTWGSVNNQVNFPFNFLLDSIKNIDLVYFI